jgi:hypothetical protein
MPKTFQNPNRSGPKLWAISVIFNNLPEVINHRLGENSPNLVTLPSTSLDIQYGQKLPNGSWTGLVGALAEGDLDLGSILRNFVSAVKLLDTS